MKRPTIENRRAKHDYFIEETITCGIALKGNEVKSLKASMANINEAWCDIENGRLIIRNMHISKYDAANDFDTDERRNRVLLAHKKEIRKMSQKRDQDGMTLIPLKIFWDRQYAKVLVGICKGKHNYDKRQSIKDRDVKRMIERGYR